MTQINDGLTQSENNPDNLDIKKTLELIEASKLIPGLMDEISPNLVKVFGKLFKDHIGSNIRPDERAQNIQGIHSKSYLHDSCQMTHLTHFLNG